MENAGGGLFHASYFNSGSKDSGVTLFWHRVLLANVIPELVFVCLPLSRLCWFSLIWSCRCFPNISATIHDRAVWQYMQNGDSCFHSRNYLEQSATPPLGACFSVELFSPFWQPVHLLVNGCFVVSAVAPASRWFHDFPNSVFWVKESLFYLSNIRQARP